jgi:DNA-binding CsgD family transcriptional regulator
LELDDITGLIEHVLQLFCERWQQSATIFNKEGILLARCTGSKVFDIMYKKIEDIYLERTLALIQCFGNLEKPTIIHSKVTFFPCHVFCPLYENSHFLVIGYFTDLLSIEFLNKSNIRSQIVESLPKYNPDEQERMIDEIVKTKAIIERLMSSKIDNTSNAQTELYVALSPREHEILHLVRRGLTNADIARELYISENTVKSHVSRVFKKLHITRRRDIIRL